MNIKKSIGKRIKRTSKSSPSVTRTVGRKNRYKSKRT